MDDDTGVVLAVQLQERLLLLSMTILRRWSWLLLLIMSTNVGQNDGDFFPSTNIDNNNDHHSPRDDTAPSTRGLPMCDSQMLGVSPTSSPHSRPWRRASSTVQASCSPHPSSLYSLPRQRASSTVQQPQWGPTELRSMETSARIIASRRGMHLRARNRTR